MKQETVAESARETAKLGRELYDHLGVFASHFAKIGKGLETAAKTYNDAASSLERRLLVNGRKFQELVVPGDELPEAKQLERTPITTGLEPQQRTDLFVAERARPDARDAAAARKHVTRDDALAIVAGDEREGARGSACSREARRRNVPGAVRS